MRRLPIGADVLASGGTHFRVWAPDHERVSVVLQDAGGRCVQESPLMSEGDGYYSTWLPAVGNGMCYRYRPGAAPDPFPDPASRFQPSGPEGPSQVVDPGLFDWHDYEWRGITLARQVLYEMHVGTFTAEGTWRAAMAELPALAGAGLTAIEMMPVADFAGERGWGYDGVNLFAPTRLYGVPDDLRRFVDTAHRLNLGVIMDVVYNHLGPRGNYLSRFAGAYFSRRYRNEWGDAINFDDHGDAVREFMIANAAYWIDEFHVDGLRLDATQQIHDASRTHVLLEMTGAARRAAHGRSIVVIAENESQHTTLVRSPESGGYGLDAIWNDDFHHCAVVALTGRREAYYSDYGGSPQEFVSMAKWGFLYQGQRYSWQNARRGTSTFGLSPRNFITFLENHDQVANAPQGDGGRLHANSSPGMYRAMTALWLLLPGVPMFFQGQEFGARTPFLYFCDHPDELGAAVRSGRVEFMRQFRSSATRDLMADLPDPNAVDTFTASKLAARSTASDARIVALHQDLLRIRREDRRFNGDAGLAFDGAVLAPQAFVLRWFDRSGADIADRLLLVNFGVDLRLDPAPEPLLAPPEGSNWGIDWSSEDPRYGGQGTPAVDADDSWRLPGHAAVVLRPIPA